MKLQPNLLLLFFFLYSYIASSTVFPNDEEQALLSLKKGLVDPLDRLASWRPGSPHCNWTGVRCNEQGTAESLDLSYMNLSGLISDDIQFLRDLSHLNICCNAFSTSLPNSISNLSSLVVLDVSQNSFVGAIPPGVSLIASLASINASGNSFSGVLDEDLANAGALEILDLRGSFFEGSIPRAFKNLKKLRFLGLSGNNLTGALPPELGELASLESMILGYNEFAGGIPVEFGNLSSLRYLDLAVANLGGRIPAELGRLKKLETIFLYKNALEGKIPPEIGNLTSLTSLDLSDNELSGEIPSEIGELKSLKLLNLMCNRLSGSVPSSIGGLPHLEALELWNNSLSGPLPGDLGRSSPLVWLDVSSNALSGEIPASLCSNGNLTKLILFSNAFIGTIPTTLSSCNSLVRVRMHNNFLSGTVPVGLGKLGRLQRLELGNNSLTGQIPNDISYSTSLSFIDLSRNRLDSSLPSTILSIPNLQTFMASRNSLRGDIPDQFQDCPSLAVLDLSYNHFSGVIPPSIASCQKLVNLNLGSNNLTGEIPNPISRMPTLAILDLSNNLLTGGIPEAFGSSPALEVLNVAHNRLHGPVPDNGVLRTINPDDLAGNAGLCGSVLPPCHPSALSAPRQSTLHAKRIIEGWVVGISSVLVIVIALLGARSVYKKWYVNDSGFQREEWPWRLVAFQRLGFTSAEIQSCVKEANVIGMGATGTVYKAELHRTNTIVAVKKLWRSSNDIETGGSDDLVGEVNVLGKLRHRNIVRLLGYLHNDKQVMILYEFMHNGSLGDTLHCKKSERLLVDWVSRYNIALGVAQGLAYLHHDCHPPVIHRDVKSNNILLDENLDARIADFGLARMMVRKNETVSMVAGSYGYIAPEYGYTLRVDEKIDIYSYGVVLLELITGKRPLETEFGECVDIVEWVRRKVREKKGVEEAIDPIAGSSKHVKEEMLLVLRIALACTAKLPKDRPSMRDVITMLGEAKPRRKSSTTHTEEAPRVINRDHPHPVFTNSPVNGLL